ncbi:MAG: DUF4838 domain-containing protein [Clostridia bacterium]|nr:DUF4838 domain-containing protein [Clostridia bacterium]
MKRLFALILMISVVAACFVSPATAGAAHGYLPGDANDDFDVSMKDVLLMRRFIAGLEEERDIDTVAADVDTDTDVTMKDVLAVRRNIAGLDELGGNNEDGRYKVSAVFVGDRNIARYSVVLPEGCDECAAYAAQVLADRINRACGYKMNITSDPDYNGCAVRFVHDADAGLGSDDFSIKTGDDGDVTIVCGRATRQRGSLYAVYHILEEFVGYRFLVSDGVGSAGELNGDTVYLYKSARCVIPEGYDETVTPDVTYRMMPQEGVTSSNFAALHINDSYDSVYAKYGWRVGTLYMNAHSYAYQMAGPERAYDHEWISAQGLHDTQPCLTDNKTYEKIVEFNRWLIDDRASWGSGQVLGEYFTQIACSPNDNTKFCMCDNCKAVYDYEGSISGTVFRLSNRVAEEMERLYPGIEVQTIAYWDARRPPKYTRPRENIAVVYCIGGCNNHSYDHTELCAACGGNPRLAQYNWGADATNSSNVDDVSFFNGWAELTDNLTIWYYSCNYNYFLAPAPNLFNVYNDIKYLTENGMSGTIFEGSSYAVYCFEYLRGYLATRMMWNPRMTEEEYNGLINEYLMIYYGDGWENIRRYIDMANEAGDLQGCWTNNYDRPWEMYNRDYFKEHYSEMASLFDAAYEAAKTEEQKDRILTCRMQCDFLGLSATYDRDWVNGSASAKSAYRARYTALYDRIVDRGVIVSLAGPLSTHGCRNFPQSSSDEDVIDPMEWLWEGCDGHWHFIDGRWQ